ncbi:hypothetical protein MesoLj113b_53150 [Mesorhizobium sp. 113-3-3]|nr:hypothetical protein MesoLj113b_53150 [Mesorhizobium sp. 113-3-3]
MGPSFRFEPESGRTIRKSGPPERSVFRFVLFYPDCNRRPRNHTGSADLSNWKALAGLGRDPYRRWGFSPRPENINGSVWKGRAAAVNQATGRWPITFCRLEQLRDRTLYRVRQAAAAAATSISSAATIAQVAKPKLE